ncbi:MAG: hypothetical protein AAGC56_05530 [Pseudomonadota bacterium]
MAKKSNRASIAVIAAAAAGFTGTLSSAGAASACQPIPPALETAVESAVTDNVNAALPQSHRLNRRKRLTMQSVRNVEVDGCRVSLRADVRLRRKVRRNANGYANLSGRIDSINLADRRACLSRLNVGRVRVSNTTRIGERAYQIVANKAIPNTLCFSF